MFRTLFLAWGRSETAKKFFASCPVTKRVVHRFVGGTTWEEARGAISDLLDKGIKVTVDFLGGPTRTAVQVDQAVAQYLTILDQIGEAGWADEVELSIRPSTLGIALHDGEELAIANATTIAAKAQQIGTTIIIGTEAPATTARTLNLVHTLREQYPDVACLLPANFKRTENDCRTLTSPGSRVGLVKGSYKTPAAALYTDRHDVDLSYIRCLKILMEGDGLPLVATHDPILIEITQELAAHNNRSLKDFEFQMLYGIRTIEQERLTDLGYSVRVRVPFGQEWYSHIIRRLTRNPSGFRVFLRAALGLR